MEGLFEVLEEVVCEAAGPGYRVVRVGAADLAWLRDRIPAWLGAAQ